MILGNLKSWIKSKLFDICIKYIKRNNKYVNIESYLSNILILQTISKVNMSRDYNTLFNTKEFLEKEIKVKLLKAVEDYIDIKYTPIDLNGDVYITGKLIVKEIKN